MSKNREIWIDNAKYVLIILVVFGHLIEPFRLAHPVIRTAWQFVYTVHMPFFVYLAGYVTHIDDTQRLRKSILAILPPLIVFSLVYECLHLVLYGQISFYAQQLAPYWILWFLLSLLFWRTLPSWLLKFKYILPSAFVISILSGLTNCIGYPLSIARTLYFFPFFILGIVTKDAKWISSMGGKIPKVVFIVGLILIGVFIHRIDIPDPFFWGSKSYHTMHIENLAGMIERSALLLASVTSIFFCIALTPKKITWMSTIGSKSLYIFLIHGLLVRFLERFDFRATFAADAASFLVFNLAAAVLMTHILSVSAVKKILDTIFAKVAGILTQFLRAA